MLYRNNKYKIPDTYYKGKELGISQKGKLQVLRFLQKIESVRTLDMLAPLWKSKYSFWGKCQSVLTLALLAILLSALNESKTFSVFLYIAWDTFTENHNIPTLHLKRKCTQLSLQQKSFSEILLSALIIFKWISKSVYLMYLMSCCPYSVNWKYIWYITGVFMMYSPCIRKRLNTVSEYTEYTKYIIFQIHLWLNLESNTIYQNRDNVPCTKRNRF